LDKFRPSARTGVKIGAILDKIAEKEKIEIAGADLEALVFQDARIRKIDPIRYVNEIKKDSERVASLRRRALRGKTLDYLMVTACQDLKQDKAESEVRDGGSKVNP
jgi:FKBP-type peptidyl-prolyl cis-trans isomerase (trigger factor)